MAILAGDIKLVASQVMDDVPEGGGAPTANMIADGVSNAIFPDISELDRSGGRVNFRKLHVTVQTTDTDTYMGSNIIVAEPPADPNVSVTLFSTRSTFDRRDAAQSRVESYLNRGPIWGGILLNNHVAGQRSIQILQALNSDQPPIGRTLVLTQDEGTDIELTQYVRTTEVSHVTRTYYDSANNPHDLWVVTCAISDALRYDFRGSEGTFDMKVSAGASRVRDTVVADAGTYVGVVPLVASAAIGDFTVQAGSIFTQLVPSAQTETAISDIRTNGVSAALVASGAGVTVSISLGFTTAQDMHVGSPVYPGSLSVLRSGVTMTDVGGVLKVANAQVGIVDYDNGILKLSTNVWGASGGTHEVTFVPAAAPDLISDQRSILVTQETRSQSYAFTIATVPEPRTMSVSYLAQARWYVLRDNGAGVLTGTDSAHGIGTLNYSTGSVSVTLGSLPDVGSSLVIQSYSNVSTVQASNTILQYGGKVYVPINTSGAMSEDKGATIIAPASLALTWNDGAARTATDNGSGILTGDATGSVDYANGVIRISPNNLPAAGTVISVSTNVHADAAAAGVSLVGGNLGATNITPGSVSALITCTYHYDRGNDTTVHFQFTERVADLRLTDDGNGNLRLMDGELFAVGTVNYTTGAINMTPPVLSTGDPYGPNLVSSQIYGYSRYRWSIFAAWPGSTASRTVSFPGSATFHYSNTAGSANTFTVTPTAYLARTLMVPNYVLKGVGFLLGATRYQELTDGTLMRDVSASTGGGTPAGSVASATGVVSIASWPAQAAPTLVNWRGLVAPPYVGAGSPFAGSSTVFRTAASPIRPASLSVLGTMQDGTTFNVSSNSDGVINGTRVKGKVNFQYGLVELHFVNPAGSADYNVDLSHLNIPGLGTIPADLAMLPSIRYNAVSFSYLPLDASILGIDPVRLPSDGRVPIFRAGGFAVVGHTDSVTAAVSNGQTLNCARVRLSRVRVLGADGALINTGYTTDLEAGTVTFANVSGYSQPVTVEHRVEDMAVVSDVQINGALTFTRPLTHAYPLGSYVSSALVAGDLKARVSTLFDQQTWNGTSWLDATSGAAATGTYNDVLSPIAVTNRGAITERWALQFTSSTAFQVVGEHVGVIAAGSINSDLAPVNSATSVPYFTLGATGWGAGWSVGNILRINTVGAMFPVWVVRTIQQGPNTGTAHSFTLLSRGDVDRA